MKIPKHFPKWDKRIDGLEDAGLWALNYERSRLPPNLVLPRTGQIWETLQDCEVSFRACIDFPQRRVSAAGLPKSFMELSPVDLKAYMLQFGTVELRRGERVRILELSEPKPIHINFVPLRYAELHEQIVPAQVRKLPGYHGYTLSVKTARTISDFHTRPGQAFFNEAFNLAQEL